MGICNSSFKKVQSPESVLEINSEKSIQNLNEENIKVEIKVEK